MNKEAKEEDSKSGKREVEREEVKTVVKRRWVNPLSTNNFEDFVPGRCWKVLGFPLWWLLWFVGVCACGAAWGAWSACFFLVGAYSG